jgi:oligopeptide transport system substrate-binding protein
MHFRFCLFILYLLLLSCNQSDNSRDLSIFHYNQINTITSLDPAFARSQANIWAIDHLYNTLITLDDSLNIVPSVAKNWKISNNGTTIQFTLRDSIYFHDNQCFVNNKGRKLIASDVAYSFQRIVDTTVNSPGSWLFKDRLQTIPWRAINDSIFEIYLKTPFNPMLGILTMQYCSIIPHEAIEFYKSDFRKKPVGTGAFKFHKWLEAQGLFLLKNKNYFEKDSSGYRLPYLDGVRVSFLNDRKTAYLEMMKGKLDFMSGLESSIANQLVTKTGNIKPERKDKIKLLKYAYLNTEYLGIRMDTNANLLLKNKKVRQAMNYAIDRNLLLRTLRNGLGSPATSGFTPKGLPSFDENINGFTFDLNKAKALIAEVNLQDSKPILLQTQKDYADLCTFLARQWESIGLKVKVEIVENALLREMMTKGDAHFFRGSWIADYPDAESFFTVFYSKNPAPPNYTRFKNTTFDVLYEKAIAENNVEKKYAIYHQMDAILIEEAPVIFLFYDQSSRFYTPKITNVTSNGMNFLRLTRFKKY